MRNASWSTAATEHPYCNLEAARSCASKMRSVQYGNAGQGR